MKTLFALLLSLSAFANIPSGLQVGQGPKVVVLKETKGGKVDGTPWSSQEELANKKVNLVFYVDPDGRSLNEKLTDRLKAEKFPRNKYASTVVINMAATWLPNDFLNALLKRNQQKFPDTTYAKDFEKVLVKEWGLPDDAYVVMAFDKDGKLFFRFDGAFTDQKIDDLIAQIRSYLH